jgi:hypothetical protein
MSKENNLKKIEDILGNWNPIGVPELIKIDEYKFYAHAIWQKCKTVDDIQAYLTSIFTQDMGYELTKESIFDIKSISINISKFLD